MKWPIRFMQLANAVATWSKDPVCQVGAVLVRDNMVIATGYNGFPSKIEDNLRLFSSAKNELMVHAEVNAILSAGHASEGAHLYVNKAPCTACAGIIIQAGIAVVHCAALDQQSDWLENSLLAINLLTEAGIPVYQYRGSL